MARNRSRKDEFAGIVFSLALVLVNSPAKAGCCEKPTRPAASDYRETIPGSNVHFDMVAIPGGTFRMGSPPGETGRDADEGPVHPVTIGPFWMGKHEVTWDEYREFRRGPIPTNRSNAAALAKDADAITRPTPPYPDETRGYGREGFPAIGISHHAAMEYCHWLSKQTGRIYRLPTEAEWEYACRAGSATAYSFGDDPKDLPQFGWFEGDAEKTQPVGKKRPNAFGLHDMHGNVSEWCIDLYRKEVYSTFPADHPAVSPVILPTSERFSHVARGGSWFDPPSKCRSAARQHSDPSWNQMDPHGSIWWDWDADFVGFRIVRPADEQEDLKGLRSQVRREEKPR